MWPQGNKTVSFFASQQIIHSWLRKSLEESSARELTLSGIGGRYGDFGAAGAGAGELRGTGG